MSKVWRGFGGAGMSYRERGCLVQGQRPKERIPHVTWEEVSGSSSRGPKHQARVWVRVVAGAREAPHPGCVLARPFPALGSWEDGGGSLGLRVCVWERGRRRLRARLCKVSGSPWDTGSAPGARPECGRRSRSALAQQAGQRGGCW